MVSEGDVCGLRATVRAEGGGVGGRGGLWGWCPLPLLRVAAVLSVCLKCLPKTCLSDLLKPVFLPVWVSTVWDLDFTETEPLDPRIEEEITEDGLGAFSSLYQALAPFATGDDKSRGVRWMDGSGLCCSAEALCLSVAQFALS